MPSIISDGLKDMKKKWLCYVIDNMLILNYVFEVTNRVVMHYATVQLTSIYRNPLVN